MESGNRKFKYKGFTTNILGLPYFEVSKKSEKNRKRFYLHSFTTEVKNDSLKNLIVMYDIPSEQKKERDWFRRQLINFGFKMIQKSVWVGPSPLPKDFIDYVKGIGLQAGLKTFKLAKPYTGKEIIF